MDGHGKIRASIGPIGTFGDARDDLFWLQDIDLLEMVKVCDAKNIVLPQVAIATRPRVAPCRLAMAPCLQVLGDAILARPRPARERCGDNRNAVATFLHSAAV